MKQSKYLIVEDSGLEIPIVFNPILQHYKVGENQIKISAGFCSRGEDGRFSVWGKSISLELKSRPEDAEILNRYIEYDC